MIPRDYIIAWRTRVPPFDDTQVEQDLVISRALVEIYSVSQLRESLAFRGGTALNKLYIDPPARYSEDIDLVQTREGPIGPILDALHAVLDPWLGTPRWKQNYGRVTLVYRFESEEMPPRRMRLKVEINTREHGSRFGLTGKPFAVDSRWFADEALIATYDFNELIGTKLRALYQRRKGRDLYDLAVASSHSSFDADRTVEAFHYYMARENKAISRAQFERNLSGKLQMRVFADDVAPVLATGYRWDMEEAANVVVSELIERLPGDPWKGDG